MKVYKKKVKKVKKIFKNFIMKKEDLFKRCPYCDCNLLSVIKPTINGNIKGIPKRKKLYYCPDCKEVFTENDEAEKDELIENSSFE
jgi:uncharacterized protein with PIN domain